MTTADDNAAAIAITLEVARRLLDRPAARNVVITQYDAEKRPHFPTSAMVSTYVRARHALGPVHTAVVRELVGHAVPVPGIAGVVCMTGMESDPDLRHTVRGLAAIEGLRLVTALNHDSDTCAGRCSSDTRAPTIRPDTARPSRTGWGSIAEGSVACAPRSASPSTAAATGQAVVPRRPPGRESARVITGQRTISGARERRELPRSVARTGPTWHDGCAWLWASVVFA